MNKKLSSLVYLLDESFFLPCCKNIRIKSLTAVYVGTSLQNNRGDKR